MTDAITDPAPPAFILPVPLAGARNAAAAGFPGRAAGPHEGRPGALRPRFANEDRPWAF
jgi:hypothetical protein